MISNETRNKINSIADTAYRTERLFETFEDFSAALAKYNIEADRETWACYLNRVGLLREEEHGLY